MRFIHCIACLILVAAGTTANAAGPSVISTNTDSISQADSTAALYVDKIMPPQINSALTISPSSLSDGTSAQELSQISPQHPLSAPEDKTKLAKGVNSQLEGHLGVPGPAAKTPSTSPASPALPKSNSQISPPSLQSKTLPTTSAIVAQEKLFSLIQSNDSIKFETLPAGSVSSPNAFNQMKQYFSNTYANVQTDASITIGTRTFFCVPIFQQPSLRSGLQILDTPPTPDDPPPGHSILGYSTSLCNTGQIPLIFSPLTNITRYQSLKSFLSKDIGSISNSQIGYDANLLPPRPAIPTATSSPASDGYVHHYAVLTENTNADGLRARLNIWNPAVSGSDMSLSQTWVVGGSGRQTETLESGWQVVGNDPQDKAVPFVFSTSDAYQSGCYDLDCVGFVQVTNQVVFATLPASGYSQSGGSQTELSVEWLRKKSTGNWWLKVNGIWVGYYPARLFLGGALGSDDPSVTLDFGGENTGTKPSMQMGSGQFAEKGYGQASFQSDIYAIDGSGSEQPITGKAILTDANCYSLKQSGVSPPPGTSGTYFYFGGPGTADPNCQAIH